MIFWLFFLREWVVLHILNKCVRDGSTHLNVINSLLSSLINWVRKSTVPSPYLRSKGIVFQARNVTRWSFQLKMVKSVLRNPGEVNNAIDLLSQREQRCKKTVSMEISTLKELVTNCPRTFSWGLGNCGGTEESNHTCYWASNSET